MRIVLVVLLSEEIARDVEPRIRPLEPLEVLCLECRVKHWQREENMLVNIDEQNVMRETYSWPDGIIWMRRTGNSIC